MEKKNFLISLVLFVAIALLIFVVFASKNSEHQEIKNNDGGVSKVLSFEDCVKTGGVVMESYPRQCRTSDGKAFTEYIGNELEKQDLIRIDSPRPNVTVNSPLTVTGEARGYWFFEASFPIRIYDANGKELGWAIAQAQDEWMTEDFVPFRASLVFEKPTTATGLLILEKDNPSGLSENDDKLEVPVVFGKEQSGSSQDIKKIMLYYYDEVKDVASDGNVMCSELTSVERDVSVSDDLIASAVQLLLKGEISSDEKARGVSTEFPLSGFSLQGSSLDDGELTLVFADPENQTVGGSCRVGLLRSQIETTVRQFPEVKSVKILPESLFQP